MVNQFEIYWVSLDPTRGSEIKKTHPCVILSPKEMNNGLKTVIIAPLTSTIREFPTRVDVSVKGKKGQVVLDQLRTVDKNRLGTKLGKLNQGNSAEVKKILLEMFQ